MLKLYNAIIFSFVCTLIISQAYAEKTDEKMTVDAFILMDLERLKQSAKPLHDSKQDKQIYNDLAGQVNALIDSVVVCVQRGEISLNEQQRLKIEIMNFNTKIENMNRRSAPINLDKNAQLSNSMVMGSITENIIINLDKILITSAHIVSMIDSHIDKNNFIQKIEERKWPIIP